MAAVPSPQTSLAGSLQPSTIAALVAIAFLLLLLPLTPSALVPVSAAAMVLLAGHAAGLDRSKGVVGGTKSEEQQQQENHEVEKSSSAGAKQAAEKTAEGKVAGAATAAKAVGGGKPDEASTAAYLSSQGVSPGARAMAAAMKAKASARAAKAANAVVRIADDSAPPHHPLVVLYGSQTGNCMEIAKTINAEAVQKGLPSVVFAMDDFSLDRLRNVHVAILVVSSTGDGDPPENATRLVGAIQRKSHSSDLLADVSYTVCGLGDSNYTRFMAVPRVFSRRMADLGAKRFYPIIEADEVDGVEDKVDEWVEGLWGPLTEVLNRPKEERGKAGGGKGAEKEAKEGRRELVGVPALQPCEVKLVWVEGKEETAANGTGAAAASAASYSSSHPFQAPVSSAKRLTADWSDRIVLHLELDTSALLLPSPSSAAASAAAAVGSGRQHLRAGDSIGITPQNNEAAVAAILPRLKFDSDAVSSSSAAATERLFRAELLEAKSKGDGHEGVWSHIPQPCSVRRALEKYCDINGTVKKGFLRTMAEYSDDEKDKEQLLFLSSRGGKEAYKSEIVEQHIGAVDLLTLFPSCHPSAAHFLDSLPPLVPRFYSLTNSPSSPVSSSSSAAATTPPPSSVQVAFSVVKEDLGNGRIFNGTCTSWLHSLLSTHLSTSSSSPSLLLPIFPKPAADFHHPDSLATPLLMIGPGTGVAPFRGFLQERRQRLDEDKNATVGQSWLFFGCRREDEDFLYREDFEAFEKEGVLSKLVVAFSRATKQKVYVQHKLKDFSPQLAPLIMDPKAHIFVCGDGAHMAKDVHSELISILQRETNVKESMAVAHLATMIKEKRYIRDVWS